jgi:hypothetical protein
MADALNMGNMSPEEYAQQQALNRQQQMATLLMQQGQQQPQGQMVSGRYVPTSFFQNLVPIANIAAAQYVGNKADTEQAKLAAAIRQNRNIAEQKISDLAFGTPEVSTELAGPYTANVPQPRAVSQEAVKPDLVSALREINTNMYGAGKDIKPLIYKQLSPEPTELEKNWKAAKAQGYTGTINDYKNQMTEADKARNAIDLQRLGLEGARYQLDKSMKEFEMGGGKLNDEQGKAVGFGTRAKEASAILGKLENEGVKDIGKTRSGVGAFVGMTPLIGEKLEQNVISGANMLPTYLGGPNEQQQATLQARKNFATAVLRKESGASISPTEFADVERIYFPSPGDDATILRQKQRARDLAINALEVQAGPGARFIKEFQPQTDFSSNASGWRVK